MNANNWKSSAKHALLASLLFSTLVANGAQNGLTVSGALGDLSATASKGGTMLKTTNSSNYLSLKLGYSNIPAKAVGFSVKGTLTNKISGENWGNYTLLRPEANVTFGATDELYFFGGINLAKYLDDNFSKLGLGKGLQAGVGYQLNQSIFIEGQYVSSAYDYEGVEFTFNALELSLGTTF